MISMEAEERRAAENLNRLVDLLETRDDQWKDHPAKAQGVRRLGEERKPRAPTGDWKDQAACQDQPGDWVFVNAHASLVKQLEAKEAELLVCRKCPVRKRCLEAGTAEEHGIWGGLLPKQRRRR